MSNSFYLIFFSTLILYCALYFFQSYIIYCLGGKKFAAGQFLDYCIPVYGWMILCRGVQLPEWMVIGLLFPPTYILFAIHLWGSIAKRLGKNYWIYGIGSTFLLFPIFVLAFDNSQYEQPIIAVEIAEGANTHHISCLSLYCYNGEFAGYKFCIPAEGFIIGRDPELSNIVLASENVSRVHARIARHIDDPYAIIINDENSTNGTFVQKIPYSGWNQVFEPAVLMVYDTFSIAGEYQFELRLADAETGEEIV